MNKEIQLNQMEKRIMTTKWDANLSQPEYHIQLVREFYRRVALWTKVLKPIADGSWPFFDIAYEISPSIRVNNDIIEKVKNHLWENNLFAQPLHNVCLWALHWSFLVDSQPKKIGDFGLPVPYEPMLVAYETNIFIGYHHGLGRGMDIGNSTVFWGKNWEEHYRLEPFIELSDFDQK